MKRHQPRAVVAAGLAACGSFIWAAPTLCQPKETAFFQCETTRNRLIALCVAGDAIQYRFGTPGKIELRVPAVPAAMQDGPFRIARYSRYRTERTEISFEHAGVGYAVFAYSEDGSSTSGIQATLANGKESRLECRGPVTEQFRQFELKLPCDAANALSAGNCR